MRPFSNTKIVDKSKEKVQQMLSRNRIFTHFPIMSLICPNLTFQLEQLTTLLKQHYGIQQPHSALAKIPFITIQTSSRPNRSTQMARVRYPQIDRTILINGITECKVQRWLHQFQQLRKSKQDALAISSKLAKITLDNGFWVQVVAFNDQIAKLLVGFIRHKKKVYSQNKQEGFSNDKKIRISLGNQELLEFMLHVMSDYKRQFYMRSMEKRQIVNIVEPCGNKSLMYYKPLLAEYSALQTQQKFEKSHEKLQFFERIETNNCQQNKIQAYQAQFNILQDNSSSTSLNSEWKKLKNQSKQWSNKSLQIEQQQLSHKKQRSRCDFPQQASPGFSYQLTDLI